MKTIIYYFTGTGNSLAAAKKIAAALGDAELVPVASLMDTPGDIVPAADRVGIICPVYFAGLPAMVASFAARLRPAGGSYIFGVATFGGSGAVSTLRQLDGILRQSAGRGLDAGFPVTMPGNYILMYEAPQGEKQSAMLTEADTQLARIADVVRETRKEGIPRSILDPLIHALVYGRFVAHVHDEDRKFTVADSCTSCGTCVAVCPVKNIELVNGKPAWQHRCELCCSCIHTCPVQAIQAGKGTADRKRYRNPDVTIAELKLRKEEPR